MSKKQDLVVIKDNEPVVGTYKLAKGFETTHQSVKKLIVKYQDRFEKIGKRSLAVQFEVSISGFQIRKLGLKKRRPDTEFLLNESQSMFLGTLLRNSEKVLDFKQTLVSEFLRQRRMIEKCISLIKENKNDPIRMQKRIEGIPVRREETDWIKKFCEYCTARGSKDANTYYTNISKMVNKSLFHLELIAFKYKNFRDIVDGLGLDALKMADRIVARALEEGMSKEMEYHAIFKLAKSRVETFADHFGKMYVDDYRRTPQEIT